MFTAKSEANWQASLLFWGISISLLIFWLVPIQGPEQTLLQPHYDVYLEQRDIDNVVPVSFTDTTLQAGIDTPHSQKSSNISGIHESLGAGVCTFDVNDDGWLDILLLTGSGSTHYFGKSEWWQKAKNSVSLYVNNRDGTFTDIASEAGLLTNSVSMGCALGDLNRDGKLDIFLANRGQNELWKNGGNNSFELVTGAYQNHDDWSTGASIADLNGDNKPDIYVTNYLEFRPNSLTFEASAGFTAEENPNFDPTLHQGIPNQLLVNKGSLNFIDEAKALKIANSQGRSLASNVFDYNDDGKLDILVMNDSNSENKLYASNGKKFEDESTRSLLSINSRTPSILVANFASEHHDSLFVSSGGKRFSRMLEQKTALGGIFFKDQSDAWRLNTLSGIYDVSWSPAIADFNLDGRQDALVVNGATLPNSDANNLSQSQASYALLNKSGSSFVKQTRGLGDNVAPVASSRCAVAGDFNNDGAPDAVIANNNGLAQLLINNTPPLNWVGLILKNTSSKTFPVGALIEIETTQRIVKRKIQNGTHGLCWQENHRMSLPLNQGETPLNVRVSYRGSILSQSERLKASVYNFIEAGKTTVPAERAPAYESIIKLKSGTGKLSVVDLLLSEQRFRDAYLELKLLLKNSDMKIQLEAAALASRLSKSYQLKLAPTLLLSNESGVAHEGLNLVKLNEDDRLARWLFGAIDHEDSELACHAMRTLEHFFSEEEAMILSKYAGLDHLIRNTLSQNLLRQKCAVKALGESERFKAVEPIVRLLDSTDPDVRKEALIALGRVRERKATITLRDHFFEEDENAQNRLLSIRSIYQIDPEFNLTDLVFDALNHPDRSDYLDAIALAFESNEFRTNFDQKDEIAKLVNEWYKNLKPELTEREQLNYIKIVQAQIGINLNQLIALSKSTSNSIRFEALLMLAVTEPLNSESFLTKVVNFSRLDHLHSNQTQNSNPEALIKALASIDIKSLSPTLELFLPYATEETKQSILEDVLLVEKSDSKKILLNHILERFRPQTTAVLCRKISLLFNDVDKYTNTLLTLSKSKSFQVIKACYGNNFTAAERKTFANNALSQPKLKNLSIKLFSRRPERWARNLTKRYLASPSTGTKDLLLVINSLPPKPFPSQARALETLYNDDSNPNVIIAAAKTLAKNETWIKNNFDRIKSRIRVAIVSGDEKIAYELAKIIWTENSREIMNIFLVQPVNEELKR